MRKTKNWEHCFRKFRTQEFSAARGVEIMEALQRPSESETLELTEILVDGEWIRLDSDEVINKHLTDAVGLISPKAFLTDVLFMVHHINFGFLDDWQAVKFPARFLSERESKESKYTNSLLANLITSGKATLKELEEYYSIHDAFKMLDVISAQTLNEMLAREEAVKDAEREARRR